MSDPKHDWSNNALVRALVWLEGVLGRGLVAIGRAAAAAGRAIVTGCSRIASTMGAMPRAARAAAAIVAGVVAVGAIFWATRDPIVNWYEASTGQRPLLAAKSWHYHLDHTSVEAIERSDADLVVMDYASQGGKVPYTADEVARMKTRRDGSKRLVVSYLSVGEGETYRWYFQKDWLSEDKSKRPSWLVAPNCAWPGAWSIKFWEDGWKDIVYRGAQSYLKRIIDAGFDGVYLDRVDIFEQFPDGKHGAPADVERAMVEFVRDLAKTARKLKPGFLVIPQNGEPLLNDKRYRRAIDGLGKEDLLHGAGGTAVPNKPEDVDWSYRHLRKLLGDYKPVFAVEYLVTNEQIAYATLALRERGLVPTFQDRSLDGSNPTMPRFDQKLTEGTPEWTKTMCDKSNSW